MIKKREIDKFPYGVSEGLTENEAKDNISKTGKSLLKIIKVYGPTVLRIALVVYLLPESALADGTPGSTPSSPNNCPTQCPAQVAPAPTQLQVLPATKELLGIAAVGLICAAASANPVTVLGIAACVVAIAAKGAGKL